jgi:hypothetical protein
MVEDMPSLGDNNVKSSLLYVSKATVEVSDEDYKRTLN